MFRASRLLMPLVVVLMLSLQAATALAAPAAWQYVDITLHSDDQQPMLLVSGELSPEVKLPADAELAVPAGTQLQWVGEILGGDPSKDPELKYSKSSSGGMDIYSFRLTQSRTAQIEGAVPSITTFDGTNYSTALKWTAWRAVPEVRISQRIPVGSEVVQASPGASVQAGGEGYSYYAKTIKAPKAGDVLDLSFSYTAPAAGSASNAAGSANNTGQAAPASDALPLTILAVLAVGGLGLLALKVKKKMDSKAAPDASDPKGASKGMSSPRAAATVQDGKTPPEPPPAAEPPVAKNWKLLVPTLIVVGLLVVGFAIAGNAGTSAAPKDGKISRDFGAASECQSASLSFTANEGVDLAKQGDQLLKGFEGMDGVGLVTIDLAQSKVDMAWCESSQSEESMRQALSASGLITLAQGTSSAISQ